MSIIIKRKVIKLLKALKPYIISILISLGVGGLSAFLTRNNMNIYSEVTMPPPELPSILFPIVWTVLYILMGIGAAMVYTAPQVPSKKKAALTVYGISLGVNFLWNIVFFNLRAFMVAFIILLLLLALIVKTIFSYLKIYPPAAYLQIPYALWVIFAGYLNFGIWWLNR